MEVKMSKTQFKELLEEYISNLEKDYDSNQTGNSNHPTYSLIKNTYQKIEDKYYYRKLGGSTEDKLESFFDNFDFTIKMRLIFPSHPSTLNFSKN